MLGGVYIPTKQSLYTQNDAFDQIAGEIVKCQNDDDVLLCGDFNGHTGKDDDYVDIDDLHNIDSIENIKEILQSCKNTNLHRVNEDKSKKDVYGNRLLDFCKSTSLCIMNGRVGQDKQIGKVTTTKGTVVDYMIASPKLFKQICDFYIDDFDPLFSDIHQKMKLVLDKKLNSKPSSKNRKHEHKNSTKIGKWKNEKKMNFLENLNSDEINKLTEHVTKGDDISVEDINKSLNNILLEAASMTFKVSPKGKRKTKILRHGYNQNCKIARDNYYKSRNIYRKLKNDKTLQDVREKSKSYKKEVQKVRKKSKK